MSFSLYIVRGFFLLACFVMGAMWTGYLVPPPNTLETSGPGAGLVMFMGGLGGVAVGLAVLFGLRYVTQELYERMAPAVVAVVLAIMSGYLLAGYILSYFDNPDETLTVFFIVSLVLLFGYAGIHIGLTRASKWESLLSAVERTGVRSSQKLVDTSVLIDGRIKEICEAGFVEGTLLVPRFILQELQGIADSPEVLRRAKGRRGLDILKALQEMGGDLEVKIIDDNPEDVRDVDGKLLKLGRQHRAKVLTNDFNLNKVAQIEGVRVLNINDLANALKPMVLPDEQMQVKIIKEGKEANQGVGYLDDGTMIVVDGGRDHLGRVVEVVVTSVLQTAAGRMIFTRFHRALT